MIFFISCTHFGHENIIKYENRPFANAEEMNKQIIKNWNEVVTKNDRVFHLGDVSFTNADLTKSIIEQLNGHKVLIHGNHDVRSSDWYHKVGFDEVSKYPIILEEFWMLSHKPLYVNDHMPYVNIHGHMHSKKIDHPQSVNVCVECINYTPISFEAVKQLMGVTDVASTYSDTQTDT